MNDTFESGYTKALLDVKYFLNEHSYSLTHCHLFNKKGIMKVIQMLIDNRQELRETGHIENLIYISDTKEFKKGSKT